MGDFRRISLCVTENPTLPRPRILHGDALERLAELADNSVDAVVTDPPYGLAQLPAAKVADALGRWLAGDRAYIPSTGKGFNGNVWDRFVPPPALWDEVLRVLKPGGYVASFAGTRTQDLMGMSLRLAGFELRDQAQWLRSDTFPKAKGVLKAGYEPILLAQKPTDGTIKANVAKWGTGLLRVDDCLTAFRSAADEAESKGKNQHGKYGTLHGGNNVYGNFGDAVRTDYNPVGRKPTNILLDEGAADLLDASVGTDPDDPIGGPSRFYPLFHYAGRATTAERPVVDGAGHDTVKPLSVIRWLVRLCTPAGGTVLDPFLGSGTTVEAAVLEGVDSIGIELEPKHLPLIDVRLSRVGYPAVDAA